MVNRFLNIQCLIYIYLVNCRKIPLPSLNFLCWFTYSPLEELHFLIDIGNILRFCYLSNYLQFYKQLELYFHIILQTSLLHESNKKIFVIFCSYQYSILLELLVSFLYSLSWGMYDDGTKGSKNYYRCEKYIIIS